MSYLPQERVTSEAVLPATGDTVPLRERDAVPSEAPTDQPVKKPAETDVDKVRSAEQKAAARALKAQQEQYARETQELRDRLQALETERLTEQTEARFYQAHINAGATSQQAIAWAREDAAAQVQIELERTKTQRELETYRGRDERAEQVAALIEAKKDLRLEYGLSPRDLESVIGELDSDDPQWERKAHKLLRAHEKAQAAEESTTSNRALRDGLPLPGGGMTSGADEHILTRPPGVGPGHPEFQPWLDRKRAYLRQQGLTS